MNRRVVLTPPGLDDEERERFVSHIATAVRQQAEWARGCGKLSPALRDQFLALASECAGSPAGLSRKDLVAGVFEQLVSDGVWSGRFADSLGGQSATLMDDYNSLVSKTAELQSQNEAIRQQLAKDLDGARSRITELESENVDLRAETAELQTTLEQAWAERNAETREVDQKKRADLNLEKLRNENKGLREKLKNQRETNDKRERQTRSQFDSLTDQVRTLETTRDELRHELEKSATTRQPVAERGSRGRASDGDAFEEAVDLLWTSLSKSFPRAFSKAKRPRKCTPETYSNTFLELITLLFRLERSVKAMFKKLSGNPDFDNARVYWHKRTILTSIRQSLSDEKGHADQEQLFLELSAWIPAFAYGSFDVIVKAHSNLLDRLNHTNWGVKANAGDGVIGRFFRDKKLEIADNFATWLRQSMAEEVVQHYRAAAQKT